MMNQLHYYEAHEAEYVKRFAAGHVGWDAGEYDRFQMRPFIARSLERIHISPGMRALDLGCGTGALSCQLAEAGLEVVGVDVSTSAIAFARKVARQRRLNITFQVLDVCRQPLPPGNFNIIVDGHLLHCIVFDQERHVLLEKIRTSLSPGGEFWSETMLAEQKFALEPTLRQDNRGRLWARIENQNRFLEHEQHDGAWWLPQRLIARSPEQLLEEFQSAGLRVIEYECRGTIDPTSPGSLRARYVAERGCSPLA